MERGPVSTRSAFGAGVLVGELLFAGMLAVGHVVGAVLFKARVL